MTTGFNFATERFGGDDGEPREGWYPVLKTGVTGDGWISAGPGYRRRLFGGQALGDVAAAVSWRGYKMVEGSLAFTELMDRRLSVGTEARWQDLAQVQYFGAGPQSQQANRSDYRLRSANVIGFASYRPWESLELEARVGRLTRPEISSSAGFFDRGVPDAAVTFAHEPGFDVARQPAFLHGQLSATVDTRDAPGHPSSGGLYRAALSTFADRDEGRFSFRRYEVEAVQFLPVSPLRATLAVHGWTVLSDAGSGAQVPAYLLASLGGSTTLRSYSDYRFHDNHLLLLSAESRWPLFEHVDVAVFGDAGGVAGRVRDLALREASYGVGLRAHLRSATVARFDVAHGREGWRLLFRLNEPFRLNRLGRRLATIPFVP
jgi:hypothetical protein